MKKMYIVISFLLFKSIIYNLKFKTIEFMYVLIYDDL